MLVKPAPLQPGDGIALVAPSGPCPAASLDGAIAYLEKSDYQIKLGAHLHHKRHYLAGTDTDRGSDLMTAFSDSSVQALFCVRGGYGSTRLLDRLDYELIQRNPKVVVGFSDTTGLHLALYARSSLVGFTGALAAIDLCSPQPDPFTAASLWRAVTCTDPLGPMPLDQDCITVIRPGRASGPLVGGCLSLLVSLLGTPYMPPLDGALLFLEDIGEAPYRIDRMLNHLRLAGVWSQLNGLILGQFKDCFTPENASSSPSLEEMISTWDNELDIPIISGVPYGHFSRRLVLPIGVQALLDTQPPQLTIEETALAAQ
jgi:muramoyltetrapeptide carboxypeptidase